MSDWDTFSFTGRIKTRPTEYLQRDKDKQIPNAMAAFVSPLDEREEVEKKIYLTQSIYNAYGKELDRFGSYVNLKRGNLGDEEYRQEILRRRFTIGGSGTEPDLSKLAQAVTNYADITFIDHYPAALIIHVSGETVPSDICQILDGASVGGVRAYSTHDYGQGAFALAGIDTKSGSALKVGENEAMMAGDENHIMGLNRGYVFINGSRLASSLSIDLGGYLSNQDDDFITTENEYFIDVGPSGYNDESMKSKPMCGAMQKED